MNRRDFMVGAAAGTVALLPPSVPAFAQPRRLTPSVKSRLPLKALRDQYQKDLFDDFLPFMEKYVIDPEFGGFRCNIDHLGNRLNHNKHELV